MSARKKITWAGLLLLIPVVVWAGIAQEAYTPLGVRPIEMVTDGDGNESADLATALTFPDATTTRVLATLGNPTVAVACDFSVASATAVITVAWLDSAGSVLSLSQATAVASRFRTAAAGDYVAKVLLFDTKAAPQYEVRHDDPSSGNVNIRAWVYGSQSQ